MPDEQDNSQPWVKWYYADWRADEKLRMCSLAARGLWMDMLALMHKTGGYLLINGTKPSIAELAQSISAKPKDTERALAELVVRGVPSTTADGVLFSRRIVRDRKKSATATANGSKGGNPWLTKSDNQELTSRLSGQVNRDSGGQDKSRARVPEARGQRPDQNQDQDHRAGRRETSPDPVEKPEAEQQKQLTALVAAEWDPDAMVEDADLLERLKCVAARAGLPYDSTRLGKAIDLVRMARARKGGRPAA
jgi:hypothetical protein